MRVRDEPPKLKVFSIKNLHSYIRHCTYFSPFSANINMMQSTTLLKTCTYVIDIRINTYYLLCASHATGSAVFIKMPVIPSQGQLKFSSLSCDKRCTYQPTNSTSLRVRSKRLAGAGAVYTKLRCSCADHLLTVLLQTKSGPKFMSSCVFSRVSAGHVYSVANDRVWG